MAHRKLDKITHEHDGMKAEFKLERDASVNANHILDKFRQFCLWMDNPNQYQLNLEPDTVTVDVKTGEIDEEQ